MRIPPVQNWEDPVHDASLLLFAQRLEECLFDYTIDSFRAPALTTAGRASELMDAARECERGNVRQEALKSVFEELVDSLKSDQAARDAMPELAGTYSDIRLWEKASIDDLRAHAEAIRLRLRHEAYFAAIRARVRTAIMEGNAGAIDAYAPLLAMELQREGYSREYIYHQTRKFFFKRKRTRSPIRGIDAFDRFLDEFASPEGEWTVYLRAAEPLTVLQDLFSGDDLQIHNTVPDFVAARPRTREWLDRSSVAQVFVKLSIDRAKDAQGAHLRALRVIELLSQYVRYHFHRQSIDIETQALIVPPGGEPIILQAPKPSTEKRPEPHIPHLGSLVTSTFEALGPATLRGESTQRILASLQMHGMAVRAETAEGQLIGLWSAIESVLPLSKVDAGIKRLKDLAVPILCQAYPIKILSALHTATRKTARARLEPLLASILPGLDSDFEKFVALMFEPDVDDLRTQLWEAVAHNRLLEFRLRSISDHWSTGGGIQESVESHRRRVDWHLSRIYRARNSLVHGGQLQVTAPTLIENLHDYYHQIIDVIADSYSRYDQPISLEAVVAGIGASDRAWQTSLARSSKQKLGRHNARQLLWGVAA